MPSLVQFEQLFDPMKRSYFLNSLFAKLANFSMKHIFFPRQALAKNFFVLHSSYTEDTSYIVWFNLNIFLAQ